MDQTKRYVKFVTVFLLACFALSGCSWAGTKEDKAVHDSLRKLSGQKVAFRIGEKSFTVELYDNPTAKDLVSKLPLTVKATDYAGYDEKVIRLSNSLSMQGAPAGDNPEIPEVGYYGPGQWIALYYGHIGYWSGKVPLGKISASVDELRAIPNNSTVKIELLGK